MFKNNNDLTLSSLLALYNMQLKCAMVSVNIISNCWVYAITVGFLTMHAAKPLPVQHTVPTGNIPYPYCMHLANIYIYILICSKIPCP